MATDPTHTRTIDGYLYEVGGDVFIAARYESGVQLRIEGVTSDLHSPVVAVFVRVGPRGGVTELPMRWQEGSLAMWRIRLFEAATHVRRIEKFRQERWGS